jgi:hypothetical protein
MHSARPHRVLAAVLCQFLATTALYAQISNASINGTVRDATGAVVPETVILLRNTATGVESRTITNDQGIYIILNILPGNYTLEGSKPGFSTYRLEPFNLVVNQRSVFDFALAVGKVQDSVSVEATGVQLQSATAELGSVLTRQQVVDLPAGRSIQNLMALSFSGLILFTADEQKLNESLRNWMAVSRSTSILLVSLLHAAIFAGNSGRGIPLARLHAPRFASAMCAITWPKFISSGLGRKL